MRGAAARVDSALGRAAAPPAPAAEAQVVRQQSSRLLLELGIDVASRPRCRRPRRSLPRLPWNPVSCAAPPPLPGTLDAYPPGVRIRRRSAPPPVRPRPG